MKLLAAGFHLLGAVSYGLAAAQDQNPPVATDNSVVPGAYIVEFEADGTSPDAFYGSLRAEGVAVSHRMDINYKLFRGASFNLGNGTRDSDAAVAAIASKPEIKNIWPVRRIQFPKPDGPVAGNGTRSLRRSPHTRNKRQATGDEEPIHIMTQVNKLRAEGYRGKGIRIGVVDTGVDYRHPALGGCFGPGCIVESGWDFTGDNYFAGSEGPVPDADPLDTCQGHGTHVTGIIVAQENELGFTGVAPDVKISAYKVSGCPGYTTSELLLSAFNRAFEEGCDIISCSAGDDSGWAADPYAIMASRIAEQGVPVIVANGNSGDQGVWESASPASGALVNAIGSLDNTFLPTLATAGTFTSGNASNTSSVFGWHQATPPLAQNNLTMELWAASDDPESEVQACEPLPDTTPDLTDRIALLRFTTTCSAETQAENVAVKGCKNILFFPQDESGFTTAYIRTEGIEGVGLVTPRQGAEWVKAMSHGENFVVSLIDPSLSRKTYEKFDAGPRAGYVSKFSSWGPTWDMEFKPQFVAPGGNILSTWLWEQGDYMVNSGTSMATPYAAALLALVGEARGTLDSRILRNVISSTSKAQIWYDVDGAHDILAPVAQQGAGLVQAYDAAHATAIISVSSFSFNDSDHFEASRSFSIENTGDTEVTYSVGHVKSATVYTYTPGTNRLYPARDPPTVDSWAEIEFDSTSVTIPAGGIANVTLKLTPPSGLNSTLLPVYGGYITLNGTNDQNYSVPYLGMAGSLHDAKVLYEGPRIPGEAGVYISSTADRFLLPSNANRTFTIPRPGSNTPAPPNTGYPKAVVAPSVGMPQFRIDVVAVGTTNTSLPTEDWWGIQSLGKLTDLRTTYMSHVVITSIFEGSTDINVALPAGTYKFVASALKIFGDEKEKSEWEFAETYPFRLEYL